MSSLVRTGPSGQAQHPSLQDCTNRLSSVKQQNLPNAGAWRISPRQREETTTLLPQSPEAPEAHLYPIQQLAHAPKAVSLDAP